jgi:hypothetical protein
MKACIITENQHMSHHQSFLTSSEVHKFDMIGQTPFNMFELIAGLSLEPPNEIYPRQGGIKDFYKE